MTAPGSVPSPLPETEVAIRLTDYVLRDLCDSPFLAWGYINAAGKVAIAMPKFEQRITGTRCETSSASEDST